MSLQKTQYHQVIIIGAGPGGITVAAALKDHGVEDVVLLDKGTIGQSWLDYPTDTHLLSESSETHDDNMIAGVSVSDVLPHIPHPSHILYQKYLEEVVKQKGLTVISDVMVEQVSFDADAKVFLLNCRNDVFYSCRFLVWAAGMYSTPNENLDTEGCYVHYAHMPYLEEVTAPEVTIVGSSNGASGVVMQLAKPGRVVHLVTSHEYVVPEPIDCLWKEQMHFIQDLAKQGLVHIIENFRVKRIYKDGEQYVLESEDGKKHTAAKRPIICTGFLPNIQPIKDLVNEVQQERETMLELDQAHQSKKQPGLYIAGAIGKLKPDEGFIRFFRNFGDIIAEDVQKQLP